MSETKPPIEIVVVEDDPAQLKFCAEVLRSPERTIVGFPGPAEALGHLAKGRPALLITDLVLPGMSGVELMKKVLALHAGLPVLAVTGASSPDHVVAAFKQGSTHFLAKPFSAMQLREAVGAALIQAPGGPLRVESPLKGWVEITAPSHEHYIERFERFCTILHASELDEKTARDIRIAVDEVGRNAVEWGNKKDLNRQVKIAYCHFGDRIVLKVEDEGEGFDYRKVEDPSQDPLGAIAKREQAGKRPGGYGLFMVRQLFDEVFFNARGNIVIMVKHLRKGVTPTRGA